MLSNDTVCCPIVPSPPQCGQQTVSMTNTCTVDNLLYTLHLAIKRRPGIQNDLSKNANIDSWMSTLLQVHRLFDQREWSQGNLLWLNTIARFKGQSWDAFGTEEDMVVSRLDYLQKTEITQTCQNVACPVAKRTCNSVDIM